MNLNIESRKTLVVVFQSLEPKDCAIARAALKDADIPYQESYIGQGFRYPHRKLRIWVELANETQARAALQQISTEYLPERITTVQPVSITIANGAKRILLAILLLLLAMILLVLLSEIR